MEEDELEEGEACIYEENASIDPDVDFSYIDEKLQHILGHLRKDFEGGVSVENLGGKYGGYGSFLPTYQRSLPIVSHAPRRVQSYSKTNLPKQLHFEGDTSNSTAPIGETFLSKNETTTSILIDQKSTKVQNKVDSIKTTRKNAEIYSGLGLVSPSSSGTSPEKSGEMSSDGITNESPGSILRDMTSIPVPRNMILSPLNESFFCLTKTEKMSENKITSVNEKKLLKGKETSSLDKSEILDEMQYNDCTLLENDIAFSEQYKRTEMIQSNQCLTNNNLKVKLSSNFVRNTGDMLSADIMIPEAQREAKRDVLVKKRVANKIEVKDRFAPYSMSKDCGSFEHKDVKDSPIKQVQETEAKGLSKVPSMDSLESGRSGNNRVPPVCRIDSDICKHEIDSVNHFVKKDGLKATKSYGPDKIKVPYGKKLSFKSKVKLKGIQTSGKSASKLVDKDNAPKDVIKVRKSYDDILDTRVEYDNNTTKALERPIGNGAKEHDLSALTMEAPPEAPPDNWVACDRCQKWRLLPHGIDPENLPDKWLCRMSTWLPGWNSCDIGEEETTRAVQEMNHQSGGNRALCGVNSVNISEAMPNKFTKKNKSAPICSSSALIQTSHLAKDEQHGLKRRRLVKVNQSVFDTNKSTNSYGEKQAANLNEKDVNGDDKKLKNKRESDQYAYKTPKKIKTEAESVEEFGGTGFSSSSTLPSMDERQDMEQHRERLLNNVNSWPKDRLVISLKRKGDSTQVYVKSGSVDRKASDKQEKHAKKRKLMDLEESQLYAEMLENDDRKVRKEKKLRICDTDTKATFLNSKDNTVDAREEKNKQQNMHNNLYLLKKGTGFQVAATSSSSKVSESCRRGSLQEMKGSSVESVSSSPMRALNLDTLSPAISAISRKGHAKGGDAMTKTPKKLLGKDAKGLEPVQDLRVGDTSKLFDGKGQSKPNSKICKAKLGDIDERVSFKNELKKGFVGEISKKRDPNEVNRMSKLLEISCFDVKAIDGCGDNVSKMLKHSGDEVIRNGKSMVKDLGVLSFMKEYATSQTAMAALKKAEEFKDSADRIKNCGYNYEWKEAYFDAALKFLYSASLLEARSSDSNKFKAMDQLHIYSSAAKLSETCATEYEKNKEMAAAALAYKCMEVAYMRVVYCKSSITDRDRHDLLATLQMVAQSDSPSSSVSDVDNVNNQATLEKTVLSKSISHSVSVAQNQANFLRMFDFTKDVISAMEASRRTCTAAANVTPESHNKEIIILVNKVIDFSFQDVKELVCLIQNAREAINRRQ